MSAEQKKSRNIVIAVVSSNAFDQTKHKYKYKDYLFEGSHTNETVPLLVYKMLNKPIDKVLFLTTEQAKEAQEGLAKYFIDDGIAREVDKIDIMHTTPISSESIFSDINKLFDLIEENDNVYIDLTGGPRDTAIYTIASMQFLKTKKVNIKNAFYVAFAKNSKLNEINDRSESYYIFDIISSLTEFEYTGNLTGIKKYYDNLYKNESSEEIKKALNFITIANDFYDELKVGRLGATKDKLEEMKKNFKVPQTSDSVLNKVVENIKNKYKAIVDKEQGSDYDLFKWCYENNHISQALGIECELLPKFIVDSRILYPCDEFMEKCKAERNSESRDWEYNFINSEVYKYNSDPFNTLYNDYICQILKDNRPSLRPYLKIDESKIENYERKDELKAFIDGANEYKLAVISKNKKNMQKVKEGAFYKALLKSIKFSYLKNNHIKDKSIDSVPDNTKYVLDQMRAKETMPLNEIIKNKKLLEYYFDLVASKSNLSFEECTNHVISMLDIKIGTEPIISTDIKEADDSKEKLRNIFINFYKLRDDRNCVMHSLNTDRSIGDIKKTMGQFIANVDEALALMQNKK